MSAADTDKAIILPRFACHLSVLYHHVKGSHL